MKMKLIEMKWKLKKCGNSRMWKCATKNGKVEKIMELIMIVFGRIYMFKEKFIEAMIKTIYVFPSRK